MNNTMQIVSRAFFKVTKKLDKHLPTILTVAGSVGFVGTVYMAVKATEKAVPVREEFKKNMDMINKNVAAQEKSPTWNYPEELRREDTQRTYMHAISEYTKLYAPVAALGTASLGMLIGSNMVMRKRNLALASAYTVLDKSYKFYRENVRNKYGNDVDKEMLMGLKKEIVQETSTDENGNEVTTTREETVPSSKFSDYSGFAKCFDELNPFYTRSAEENLKTLRLIQNHANDRLRDRGYLTLNEAYEMFGFDKTKDGFVVGWLYRPDDPNHIGDNKVDVGLYDISKEGSRDFVNGRERAVWLDFNVDGIISDKF